MSQLAEKSSFPAPQKPWGFVRRPSVRIKKIWGRNEIRELNEKFDGKEPWEILEWVGNEFGAEAVLGTSFGPSGIVLTHMLSKIKNSITVFYLDTGLFFKQTYDLRDELERKFGLTFVRVSTDLSVEEQETEFGSELWKRNPNKCCLLRKVLPLKKYLSDKRVWITGIRRSQSDSRINTRLFEWDPLNEVLKVNPLATWTSGDVWSYIYLNELPYNPLHDDGYPSIGCMPCTHPVSPGEHERAGRWAGHEKTECGIHLPAQENGHNQL